MASSNPPMDAPPISPEQANAILKPLAAFAKGIANISGSFARASVAPIKSAASFTGRSIKSTGGIVRQRIGDAGFDRAGITSTLFDDNPMMNALSGMIGDMSSKIAGVGKKFLFGSGENKKLPSEAEGGLFPGGNSGGDKDVSDIKEDVGILRKLSEEDKKREKKEIKDEKRIRGTSGLINEMTSSNPTLAAMRDYYEGLQKAAGKKEKEEPRARLLDTLSGAFKAGGMMMLGKMLVKFLFGKSGPMGKALKSIGKMLLGGLKGGGKSLAKGFSTIGGKLLGGVLGVAIDGILGYFKSDEWGVSKTAGTIGGMLGGTFDNMAANMFVNAGKWALAGMALGSVVPVIGTAIGGAVGALLGAVLGYFGGERIAKATDELGKQMQKMWGAVSEGWTEIMDSIITWLQTEHSWIAKGLGLKTSKQKAAQTEAHQGEQEKRAAHQEYMKGRPLKTLPGGGQMALTDEEMARTESDRAWLASPEMVALATSGSEGAAEYARISHQIMSGKSINPLNNMKQLSPAEKDLRLAAANVMQNIGVQSGSSGGNVTTVVNNNNAGPAALPSGGGVFMPGAGSTDQGVSQSNR